MALSLKLTPVLLAALVALILGISIPSEGEPLKLQDRDEVVRAREVDAFHHTTTLAEKIPHAVKYFETIKFNAVQDEDAAVAFLVEFFTLVRANFTHFGLISVKPELQGVQGLLALAFAMDETGRRHATSVLEMIEETLPLSANAEPNAYQRVIVENQMYAEYLLLLRFNVMAYLTLTSLDPQTLDLPRRALFSNRILLADVRLDVIRNCTQWIREATRLRTHSSQVHVRHFLDTPLKRRYKRLSLWALSGRSPRARAERALIEAYDAFVAPIRPQDAD